MFSERFEQSICDLEGVSDENHDSTKMEDRILDLTPLKIIIAMSMKNRKC